MGKKEPLFKKKPQLALELIERSLERGYRPGIVLIDSGYANNTNFLKNLELRRRWANQQINTFPEALEAFRTAMSYRFIQWLNQNLNVFAAYKASLGFVWA